jgi:molecular chaperone GrpE
MEGRPVGEQPAAAEETPEAEGDLEPRPAADPADAKAEDAAAVESDLDELAAAHRQRDEYLELAQRTKADFENYRKRAARDAADAELRGRSALARELVPVLDNLERALLAAGVDPQGTDAKSGDGEALAQGVLLVYRDLRSTVERAGVETYDPAGERFDPQWHEALSTRPGDGADPGTVVETVEKGYRLGDQVLRPARVIVSE